jgi:PPOX class probable F420-dependent enzyme
MIGFEPETPYGHRVANRLATERVAWLVTVDGRGTPQPLPIWFLWDGKTILIYSQPETAKLRNLARSDRASLHLNSDAYGDDIVVLTGTAAVDESAPPASDVPAYIEKYADGLRSLGMTPEAFAASYSVPIRFRPRKVRGW